MQTPDPPRNPSRVRMRQIRVLWLPLLLVALNAIIVFVATVVALLLIPLAVVLLTLAVLLRWAIYFLSGGRLLARKRRPEDAGGPGLRAAEERRPQRGGPCSGGEHGGDAGAGGDPAGGDDGQL